jgi:restriction system protein
VHDNQRIRPSGGYRDLRSFQTTTIIYDATVSFCERFVDKRSRTVDQMVQAARSGRQNIAEGSRAAATSSQTELRLISVARASLDELLLDYEDFLRQRNLVQWSKDSHEAMRVRAVGQRPEPSPAVVLTPSNLIPSGLARRTLGLSPMP